MQKSGSQSQKLNEISNILENPIHAVTLLPSGYDPTNPMCGITSE